MAETLIIPLTKKSFPSTDFVYTLDHQLLYLGKADNLRTRWNAKNQITMEDISNKS